MKYLVATLLFLFPASIARWVVNLSKRYRIAHGVKIGFSLILVNKLCLEEGVRIGSANFIKVIGLNIKGGGE